LEKHATKVEIDFIAKELIFTRSRSAKLLAIAVDSNSSIYFMTTLFLPKNHYL